MVNCSKDLKSYQYSGLPPKVSSRWLLVLQNNLLIDVARMLDSALVHCFLSVYTPCMSSKNATLSLHFAVGFFGVQSYLQDYHQLIMIEAPGFNNTLASSAVCPNANNAIGNFGRVQSAKWANVYLQPALKRVSKSIQGIDLTISDLVGMQMTCAYEVEFLPFSVLVQ